MSENNSRLVVVSGSRDELDERERDLVASTMAPWLAMDPGRLYQTVLMHGAARGVDRYADEVARDAGVLPLPMPAPWETMGRRAGPARNQHMLDVALAMHRCGWEVVVLAFPRQSSRGTRDMIERAEKMRDRGDVRKLVVTWLDGMRFERPDSDAHLGWELLERDCSQPGCGVWCSSACLCACHG